VPASFRPYKRDMTIDERAALPPGPTYSYAGFTAVLQPVEGSETAWRVVDGDDGRYFGLITTADPVKGEPEVHFAAHFPDEEKIPPIKIVPLWTAAVEFLIDARHD